MRRLAALFLACLIGGSCGGGGRDQCITGQSIACACQGGGSGGQVCLADGTYGECVCGSVADGAVVDGEPAEDAARPVDAGVDGASPDAPAAIAIDAGVGSDAIVGECNWSVAVPDVPPSGEITGSFDSSRASELSSAVCLGFGGEQAFRYVVTVPGRALHVTTDFPETTVDTVVYVRTNCRAPTTELACDDDSGAATGEAVFTTPVVTVGTYFIIVDTFGPGSIGTFKLQVTEVAPGGPVDAAGVVDAAGP